MNTKRYERQRSKRLASEKAQIEALIENIDHVHRKHLTR